MVSSKNKKKHKGECLVFHDKDKFHLTFISKVLNATEVNSAKQDVFWFCNCLLQAKKPYPQKDFEISKIVLMNYIYHHIAQCRRYRIYDELTKSFVDKSDKYYSTILYASLLQGGVNRKYLMQYYYHPLKVLENEDIIISHSDFLAVDYKKLQKFRQKLQKQVRK